MTYRQQLAALPIGQRIVYPTKDQAQSARKAAGKFYNHMRFRLAGNAVERIA